MSNLTNTYRIREIASADPSLGLVAVGIEIEKAITELAGKHDIETYGHSAGRVLGELERRQVVPPQVAAGLRDLIALRNKAAHGAQVSADASSWAVEEFPVILASLHDLGKLNKQFQDRL